MAIQLFATEFALANVPGIYNSSTTPPHLPWDTYNYCNAPHVNAQHYRLPENANDAKLVYLNVVTRHHKVRFNDHCRCLNSLTCPKRTPDNLFPSEKALNPPSGWNCSDFIQEIYGGGTRPINRQTIVPSWHPYSSTIWSGTCDSGQLTQQGLDDAVQHGKVAFISFPRP
jgi:2-phosphoxylose phosphatase